jgi:hypothetical protein
VAVFSAAYQHAGSPANPVIAKPQKAKKKRYALLIAIQNSEASKWTRRVEIPVVVLEIHTRGLLPGVGGAPLIAGNKSHTPISAFDVKQDDVGVFCVGLGWKPGRRRPR